MTGEVVRRLLIHDARSRPADEVAANADAPSDLERHPGRLALLRCDSQYSGHRARVLYPRFSRHSYDYREHA